MAFTITSALALLFVSTVHCYPSGAPVKEHPNICNGSMMPLHDATAQNSLAPVKLIVSGCYKAGQAAKVTVKATSGEYEGMFMLARPGTNQTSAVGTFTAENTKQFKRVNCYNQTGSAVTQLTGDDYTSEIFWWTAPNNFNETVRFQATIVKEKDEFWVDVFSSDINYLETCPKDKSGTDSLRLPASLLAALVLVAPFLRLQ